MGLAQARDRQHDVAVAGNGDDQHLLVGVSGVGADSAVHHSDPFGGQLARRYNIPYRTSNVCAANTVDAQAAYESVFSLWGCVQSGGNFIKHAAGWLEGGLSCSYEKTMLDIDLLQIARREATALLARDPALENPEHKLMKQVLKERWESAAITLE